MVKIFTTGNLKKKGEILLLLFFIILHSVYGKERFSLEFLPGGAVIIPSSLFIRQDGFSDLKFIARYRTESFNLPIYYSCRIGYRINQNSNVELEMNHLKVKLDNNPPEIEVFSISHGFNQFWINYALTHKGFVFRMGAGAVIAHPESIIRGNQFDTTQGFLEMGYYMSGITSQVAVQKKIFIGKHLFFSAESKINAAYARVKIADGLARVPIFAIHGLIGLGVKF